MFACGPDWLRLGQHARPSRPTWRGEETRAALLAPACAQPRRPLAPDRLRHRRACARPACPGARCRGTRAGTAGRPRRRSPASRRTARRSRSESRRSGRRRSRCPAAARAPARSPPARRRANARRFIRFRIRSLPACSDRCRCGISRGSSAISRHRSSSIAAGSIEDSRSRGSSGTSASSRRTIWPRRRRARQIGAVARRCRRRSARPPDSRAATSARTCATIAPIGTLSGWGRGRTG